MLRRLEAGCLYGTGCMYEAGCMTLADNEMPSVDNWNEIVVLAATGMNQYQAK